MSSFNVVDHYCISVNILGVEIELLNNRQCDIDKILIQYVLDVCCVLDIPVIPDLDEVQEEDLNMQVAAPPRYCKNISRSTLVDPSHSVRFMASHHSIFMIDEVHPFGQSCT